MTLETPKRFTLTEYHRLIELGFLTEDDRIELIRGELIQIAAKGTPHSVCNTKLFRELDRLVRDRAVVRAQINDYWIVNLVANQLELYSQPYQDAQGNLGYRFKQIALRYESVALPGFPDLSLELDRVFPGSGVG